MIQPSVRPDGRTQGLPRGVRPPAVRPRSPTCTAPSRTGPRPATWSTSSCGSRARSAAAVHAPHAATGSSSATGRRSSASPTSTRPPGQGRAAQPARLAALHPHPTPQPEEARMSEVEAPAGNDPLPRVGRGPADRLRPRPARRRPALAQGDAPAGGPLPLHRPRPPARLPPHPDEPRRRPLSPGPGADRRRLPRGARPRGRRRWSPTTPAAPSRRSRRRTTRSGSAGCCSPTATRSRTSCRRRSGRCSGRRGCPRPAQRRDAGHALRADAPTARSPTAG